MLVNPCKSVFEGLFEILLGHWTNSIFLLLHTGLVANIGIWVHHKILNKLLFTLSEIGVSQMQHFFLYVNLR